MEHFNAVQFQPISKEIVNFKKKVLKTYYGTKLPLESSTHFLKVSTQNKTNGNYCPLSLFRITMYNFTT